MKRGGRIDERPDEEEDSDDDDDGARLPHQLGVPREELTRLEDAHDDWYPEDNDDEDGLWRFG